MATFCKIQSAALGQSQGFIECFLGSSVGWWADTADILLPGKEKLQEELLKYRDRRQDVALEMEGN